MKIELTSKEMEILAAAHTSSSQLWDAMRCDCDEPDCEACKGWKQGHDANDNILPLPFDGNVLDCSAISDISTLTEILNAFDNMFDNSEYPDSELRIVVRKLLEYPPLKQANTKEDGDWYYCEWAS